MFPEKEDPLFLLLDAMANPDGAIERQESRGQKIFVSSDVMYYQRNSIRAIKNSSKKWELFLGMMQMICLFM